MYPLWKIGAMVILLVGDANVRKPRVILRMLPGITELRPGPEESLWAKYESRPSAPLKTAGLDGRGVGRNK